MQTTEIELEHIIDPHFQPRSSIEVEGLEALANSIREIGLLNPIIVKKEGEGYELIAGTRRTHAFKLLGYSHIPATIIAGDTRESAMLQFSENFHRQDLSPIQQADMLKFMIENLGYSVLELTQFCNKSKEWVSRQLSLLDLDEPVQAAIEDGRISPSVAIELKVIPDETLRRDYINYAITGGCTEKAAREWARQAKATIAARDARIQERQLNPEPQETYTPPAPEEHKCRLCGAPEDAVKLEQWEICWHCAKTLTPVRPE